MTTKDFSFVEKWKRLPWSKFDHDLFRLQHRIYEATKSGNNNLVKRLQTLLFNSNARYLAVRQVTQLNRGKKTAGVDGIKSIGYKERLILADKLFNLSEWKHQKLRKIYIPKPSGEKRPLGIPTINDRAVQCLIKYALEPVYEAQASRGSYGFRPGRSAWDIQNNIYKNLQSTSRGYKKLILELDIEKCFDKIEHKTLMSMVILPKPALNVVWSALKAGVLKEIITMTEGILQDVVISPLLCNIALNGIEDLWNEKFARTRIYQRGLRYADDMIFFIKPHEDVAALRRKIDLFLSKRGLNIKENNTKIVKSTDGFDFLGWHFKVKSKNKKFVSYPSQKNYKQMIYKIKTTMQYTRFPMKARLDKIKVIYRGWFNYHQYCDMSQLNLWSISSWTNEYLIKNSTMDRKERVKTVSDIFIGHTYKVNSFQSVIQNKSPYDSDWLYWAKRGSKQFSGPKLRSIRFQKFRCKSCNYPFKVDDIIELHHVDGNNKNNNSRNLAALHRSCHLFELNQGRPIKRMVNS
jgi:group II intron reverse transcriptase/maturase